ncbi:MAG: hypothetical protein HXP18_01155 [Veillonella sp.]|nr:hypothetical protein [Veillonella sp.]
MAEDLTVGHPSFYRGSGLEGRPLFAPNRVPNQGTPLLAAERPQPMQFGDTLRGYSLYQLLPNYVGVPAAQPQAVPMYLNPNTQPADPMGVFQRFRNAANGIVPVAQPQAQVAAQPVAEAQSAQQAAQAASVTQPQQVAAPQSIVSVESLPRVDVPKMRPQQNDIRFIASQGVDALDGGDAAIDFGRRYAAAAATGAVPVVSNAMLAALNRQHARNQAALSAATKAQDVNDMYAAMNDPNLRARAHTLSKANGISFDLAMKQAVQSKLLESGDYNLANRYGMSQILPQIDAEQQRRVTEAINFGGSATPVRDPYGADIQTNGINYAQPTADGNYMYTTANNVAVGTPNAGTMYGVINGSSSPTNASYNVTQANIQTGLNAQQAAAKQLADARAQVANQEKTALDMLNKRLTTQAQLLRANASQQNAATRAATAGNNGDSQAARTMLATLKALPDGDPRKAQIMQALTDMYVSPTSPTE